MTQTLNPAPTLMGDITTTLVAQAITYNTDVAGGYDQYWTPEIEAQLPQGTPALYVSSSAPGLGKTVIYVAYVGLELPDGSHVSCGPAHVERVNTNLCRPDVRQHGEEVARRALGAAYPVRYKHVV